MNHRNIIRCSVVALFSLSAGGCSLVFVNGPPIGHEERDFFLCTDDKTAPALDVIVAGLFLLNALNVRTERAAGGLFYTGIFGTSAYTGLKRVKQCQSAQLEAARRRAGEDANAAALASPDTDPAPWPAPLAPPLRRPNGGTGTRR